MVTPTRGCFHQQPTPRMAGGCWEQSRKHPISAGRAGGSERGGCDFLRGFQDKKELTERDERLHLEEADRESARLGSHLFSLTVWSGGRRKGRDICLEVRTPPTPPCPAFHGSEVTWGPRGCLSLHGRHSLGNRIAKEKCLFFLFAFLQCVLIQATRVCSEKGWKGSQSPVSKRSQTPRLRTVSVQGSRG